MVTKSQTENWLKAWGHDWLLEGCANCNGVFVLSPDKVSQRCPFCGQSTLEQMNPSDDRPTYTQPAELMLPFQAKESQLQSKMAKFVKSIWLAPSDLSEATLQSRLQPLYLPMWLVDAQVQGQWQAEVGFDYEIVSHQEKYRNNQWESQRVQEGRVRWEPRLGRLNRAYDNQAAPALEEQQQVEAQIGRFDLDVQKPFFNPDGLAGATVRLPNRPPEDAWSEAMVGLKVSVLQDCRRASKADRIRGFKWSPSFANQHWTQLLLPVYTSYYLDDNEQAQIVLLHGQTGKLHAVRRASMKRARRLALIILAVTAVLLLATFVLLGLGFTLDDAALPWAGMLGVFTVGVGGTAVLPLAYVWYVNNLRSN
ncbi:hypothetical protein MNBD_CHLOROFLEXI01-2776 [hydrothermal vent metagenome]|uniref:Primosomal protein N' (Replication factor Y)-superfamily II helicase n=1 Tax=hydrothermal vent metagenome TaxID=652676 RepID=A0A3B0VTB4_9ZZZZ